MAVGPLEHGVTPLQGRGRRQRDDPGERVRQLGVGPVQQMAQDPAATPEERVHLGLTFVHQPLGPLHGGTAQRVREPPLLAVQQPAYGPQRPVPQLLYALQLLAHVRDDLLGRVRGRGGAQIGDQVQQRGVRLMADRGDHRRTAGGHGPDQLLVGERQQILDAAAAPGHHDHVDLVQRVQLLDRLHHLGDRVHPLHGGVADLEAHGGPAAAGVLQDVPLGGGGPPADEPDELREEGERLLPVEREETLGGERLLELLQPHEQLTDADRPYVGGPQRQLPRGAYHSGFARTTTRAPSVTTSAIRSKTCRKQVTLTEMSCDGSRSVRKTTPAPGRRDSWVI
ncbi:hypothetical protein SBADM41S_09680 [Streptomyces badius]